ncbi:hypothetical protein ACIGXI_34540 [Kitasatospora aureofaciens]|uniref:hypothetical protein n=1 Tax=Kitasatospora aureofaciens TaxID=1894 RepID=UPI0037C7004E
MSDRRYEPNRDPGLDLGVGSARGLANDLGRAASGVLGLNVTSDNAPAILADLLDDFTHTDLSAVDLTSINLEGIRWSVDTTRWPAAVDVERLRQQSLETHAGSGIDVVKGGPAEKRATDRTTSGFTGRKATGGLSGSPPTVVPGSSARSLSVGWSKGASSERWAWPRGRLTPTGRSRPRASDWARTAAGRAGDAPGTMPTTTASTVVVTRNFLQPLV